jgi:general secretion pathway protein A
MYLPFFNLRESPFRLTPDPKFLHLAEPHRLVLAEIIGGVVFRKGFVLVTGPVGTGKTTLIHTALQILNRRLYPGGGLLSAFLVNPTLTRDEFLESLLQEFEIKCASTTKPARLAALSQAFITRLQRGTTSVVFVDEAHLLSSEILEELRLLNNVDSYREKLLQIILVGQPELNTVLQRPELAALRQRIASRCRLRPLSLAESHTYLAERLHAAGMKDTNPFTTSALERIYDLSSGVPRLLNLICDRAMTIAFERKSHVIGPEIAEAAGEFLDLNAAHTYCEGESEEPASGTPKVAAATL